MYSSDQQERYLIITVSEDELWEFEQQKPKVRGPSYCAVLRNGTVRFYPPFDPAKFDLQATRKAK